MNSSAEALAFLAGLDATGNSGAAAAYPGNNAEVDGGVQATAGPAEQINGQANGSYLPGPPALDGSSGTKKKRNRWGPAPGAEVKQEGDGESKPAKKRRSRWEDVPETNTDTTLALVPKEIVIAGNIKVRAVHFSSLT